MVDLLGFQGTFLVTAALKAASYLPLLLLLHYVPDGVCRAGGPAAAAAGYAVLPECAAETPAAASECEEAAPLLEPPPQGMPR